MIEKTNLGDARASDCTEYIAILIEQRHNRGILSSDDVNQAQLCVPCFPAIEEMDKPVHAGCFLSNHIRMHYAETASTQLSTKNGFSI
jgi:hypothetical protein